ncbi:MlaA family lipoprotein [Amphiplicatus metriothermophilus]|uniref:Phospholipid-binding lipoprotein MlaA n=1 Tax=Amphiplicatus metriothermophilus TaxID=1519374 RepID=A0A239Q1E0_9PROT|nr:VacJ family lipoprotein [Amphiplicatus metriothermophilus]MBB5520159.1 phospholipid-binding lipoprotein MlaA [Amphiplicatus metriothermophilus]SNT75747.1 phospholipid-binding lipoprotein MlaA [Amphiplicatus metriothermophilus]
MRGRAFKAAAAAVMGAALSIAPAGAQIGVGDVETATEELERAAENAAAQNTVDPWEGFNRRSFHVYLFLDETILVPAAKAYRAVTPKKGRKGIRNFLDNAQSPVVLVNDILQGEFKRAGDTLGRFVINSTIGFGGFADPAGRMGIPKHTEDFGQTLAVWGVPSGPFLMLPIFGPTTLRDGVGLGVDVAIDPLFHVETQAANRARYSRFVATAVSRREPLIEPLDDIQEKSLDYYASLRSFYLQARKREIANGRTSYEDLPDIGEYEEFDGLE